MTRRALDALALRLDGTRAAAATITRKRAVFHGCLGYAAELGLLESNPLDRITWQPPEIILLGRPAVGGHTCRGQAILADDQDPPGADRVLRLPVLRGTATRRSRRAVRQLLRPPLTRLGAADPHSLPSAVGACLDQ